MRSNMDTSICDLLATTLSELCLPTPTNVFQTMLMKNNHFIGHKFHYDGGFAILWGDGNTIGLYDEQGKLLKTVGLKREREAA